MNFSLLGICLDRKNFRRGSDKAPFEIKRIFSQLETYINGVDLQDVWLKDLGYVEPNSYEEIIGLLPTLQTPLVLFLSTLHFLSHNWQEFKIL